MTLSTVLAHLQWASPIIRRCVEMMPDPNVLQVDIFVTNFTDPKFNTGSRPDFNPGYLSGTSTDRFSSFGAPSVPSDPLAPPAPRFAREGRAERRLSISSDTSVDSTGSSTSLADLHYEDGGKSGQSKDAEIESEIGHVLDLTNFDGDDDTRVPGEAQFSLKVKKEGKVRRAQSRRVANAAQAKLELSQKAAAAAQDEQKVPLPSARIVPQSYKSPTKSKQWDQTDALLSPTNQRGFSLYDPPMGVTQDPHSALATPVQQRWAVTSPTPRAVTPRQDEQLAHPSVSPTPLHSRTYSDNRFSLADSLNDYTGMLSEGAYDTHTVGGSESMRYLMTQSRSGADTGPATPSFINVAEDLMWDFDEEELDDLNVVSEMARPGKPKLERILADEVERSRGPVAVACEFDQMKPLG